MSRYNKNQLASKDIVDVMAVVVDSHCIVHIPCPVAESVLRNDDFGVVVTVFDPV